MAATLLAIALLGDIEPVPDNCKAYDRIVAQIYDDALAGPLAEVAAAKADLKSRTWTNAPAPQIADARKRLALANEIERLTKLTLGAWPPPIQELSFPNTMSQSAFEKFPYGRLRYENAVHRTYWTITEGNTRQERKHEIITHKSRYVVVKVLSAYSMEVVEHYSDEKRRRPRRHLDKSSPAVRVDGLSTRGAVPNVSEMNIGGKFFEDRGMLRRSANSNEKIRVLRFLH